MNEMTEKKAAKKWCPLARVATYDKLQEQLPDTVSASMCATNKASDGKIRTGAYCIGSACMAWRWVDYDGYAELERKAFGGDPVGFCGAFGSPRWVVG